MSQTVVNTQDDVPSDGHTSRTVTRAGLYILFATEMWERFGFYTAAAMMTLYLQRGGFGWTKTQATTLWSNYLMFVYATPLIGGWLADKFLGYRRSVLIGGLFFIAGYALLGLGSIATFYHRAGPDLRRQRLLQAEHLDDGRQPLPGQQPAQGLGLQHLLHGDQRRCPARAGRRRGMRCSSSRVPKCSRWPRRASTLSPEQAASLRAGFLTAFYAAAVGMTLGTVILSVFYRKLADAERRHVPLEAADPGCRCRHRGRPARRAGRLGDRQVPEATRITALLVIYGIVIVFWMVFHQNGSTMTYWADENTDVERLGRRLQRDQPVLDRRALDPAGQRLELAAQARARAVDARPRWPWGCCSPAWPS